MREHDALGVTGRAARGDHEGVTVLDGAAARLAMFGAVLVAARPSAARAASWAALAGGGSRWSIGKHGVAAVPGPCEGGDELRAGGKVEGDELSRHG